MDDKLNLFADFDAVVDACKRKPTRKLLKWEETVANNRRRRTQKHKRELLRDKAKFIRTVIDGEPQRARPKARATIEHANAVARGDAEPRWLELLRAMGEGDWTMSRLCVLFDRDIPTTSATIERGGVARGFVERRANPDARMIKAGGGARPYGDRWLYRATARGLEVAAGAEWRKPRKYVRWKYRRLREAKITPTDQKQG